MKYLKVLAVIAVFSVLTAFFSESFFKERADQTPPLSDGEDDEKEQISEKNKDYSRFATEKALLEGIEVSARSAILCTADGRVIFEKNSGVSLPMASITKVMSVIIALENNSDLSASVLVPKQAVGIEGSSVYLTEGERVTLEMLIYSAMLESANDAVTALAILTAGSLDAFVQLMNEKARALSMTATHFCNPHGLHESEHFTTARDYAVLMSYALENETFCKVIATKKAVFQKADGSMSRVLTNHNRLLNTCQGMLGGKTGFTKASGRTLVTAAKRNGTTLICVTIDAPSDWNDHTEMYQKGFEAVKTVSFGKELTAEVPIAAGQSESVCAVLIEPIAFTVEANDEITYAVKLPHMAFAPIEGGETLGVAEFYKNGKLIKEVPLVAQATVGAVKKQENKGFIDKLLAFFGQ